MSGFAGQGDGRGSRRRVLHKPAGAQKSSKADSVSLCQLSDPGHRGRGGACAEDDNAGYTGGGSRVTVIVRTSRSACSAVPGSPGSPGSPGLSSASPVAGPGFCCSCRCETQVTDDSAGLVPGAASRGSGAEFLAPVAVLRGWLWPAAALPGPGHGPGSYGGFLVVAGGPLRSEPAA